VGGREARARGPELTSTYLGGEPVKRSEPHWYKTIFVEGCVLCGRGGETIRVRVAGEPPEDDADRYEYDNSTWACGDHFA
jgi:hypothetical protein